MYRPRPYAVDDIAFLHGVIRNHPFATVATVIDGAVTLAYAPVLLESGEGCGTIRFHLARANPVAAAPIGSEMTLSFLGPDAYVSPDWYASAGMVPTWNYIAVEARGRATHLAGNALRGLLADLSSAQEAKLAPKKPWTIDKVPGDKLDAMLQAIVGFEVPLDSLEGKFKLSQDKKPDDVAGVIAALEAQSDGRARHVAAGMRRWSFKK